MHWPVPQLHLCFHWSQPASWRSGSTHRLWEHRFAAGRQMHVNGGVWGGDLWHYMKTQKELTSHLANIVDLNLSLWVPSGNLLSSVRPSDTVQCRSPIHIHTSSWNLKYTQELTEKQMHTCSGTLWILSQIRSQFCNSGKKLGILRYHCWGSTSPDVQLGPHKQTGQGVLETTLHRRRSHNCPQKSIVDGYSTRESVGGSGREKQ